MATRLVQIGQDQELQQRLAAERARLRQQAGLSEPTHFHRPVERAFTADERLYTIAASRMVAANAAVGINLFTSRS